jgi:Ca-activated chloride channel family protein
VREFFQFADPWWLLLLLAVPPALWLSWKRRGEAGPHVLHARILPAGRLRGGWRVRLAPALAALPYLAWVFWALAMARPQFGTEFEQMTEHGVDMMLALDVSSSMLAEDFRPANRLHVAKQVAKDFVRAREHDRIGLTVFAGQSAPRCPPTLDHGVLLNVIDQVEAGRLEDGTAVGMGIAVSLERLRRSDAESRIIILLTDGKSNRGQIDPLTAANLAKTLGVKIYAIGIGSHERVRMPVDTPMGVRQYQYVKMEFDEDTLKEIAGRTGGRYFSAQNAETLQEVFREIDRLEKSDIESVSYTRYRELFPRYAEAGLLALAAWLALGATWFRRLP